MNNEWGEISFIFSFSLICSEHRGYVTFSPSIVPRWKTELIPKRPQKLSSFVARSIELLPYHSMWNRLRIHGLQLVTGGELHWFDMVERNGNFWAVNRNLGVMDRNFRVIYRSLKAVMRGLFLKKKFRAGASVAGGAPFAWHLHLDEQRLVPQLPAAGALAGPPPSEQKPGDAGHHRRERDRHSLPRRDPLGRFTLLLRVFQRHRLLKNNLGLALIHPRALVKLATLALAKTQAVHVTQVQRQKEQCSKFKPHT